MKVCSAARFDMSLFKNKFTNEFLYGFIAASFIATVILIAFFGLSIQVEQPKFFTEISKIINSRYIANVVVFTLLQAFVSAVLCLLSIFIALSLQRREFIGKTIIFYTMLLSLVTPIVITSLSLIKLYSKNGLLGSLLRFFGFEANYNLYGFYGVLLIHVFLNLPFCVLIIMQVLKNIPKQYYKVATMLNMSYSCFFKHILLANLKEPVKYMFCLIFMICVGSFSAALMLGGTSGHTVTVAIYQALKYEFNVEAAVILSIVQLTICLTALLIMGKNQKIEYLQKSTRTANYFHSKLLLFTDVLTIVLFAIFLISPFVVVTFFGMQNFFELLLELSLWQAFFRSLIIAFVVALISNLASFFILCSVRAQSFGEAFFLKSALITIAIPSTILASGWFIVLINADKMLIYTAIILLASIVAIPYNIQILKPIMVQNYKNYFKLSQMLRLNFWQFIKLVDLKTINKALLQSFIIAALISFGDFGIIAFFGSAEFQTLPLFIYEQFGAYRVNFAFSSSLFMLISCLILFILNKKYAT